MLKYMKCTFNKYFLTCYKCIELCIFRMVEIISLFLLLHGISSDHIMIAAKYISE